ncbi:MAG: hypothetical protein V3S01_00875 [Dehalococcoidia bacterium]
MSLDPSSTCTGMALFSVSGALVSATELRPPAKWSRWQRIAAMCQGVRMSFNTYQPDVVVMEVPSGNRTGSHRREGKKAIVACSEACGAVAGILMGLGVPLAVVEPNVWTGGSSKEARIRLAVARIHNTDADILLSYQDAGDAVALGLWWYDQDAVTKAEALTDTTARRPARPIPVLPQPA